METHQHLRMFNPSWDHAYFTTIPHFGTDDTTNASVLAQLETADGDSLSWHFDLGLNDSTDRIARLGSQLRRLGDSLTAFAKEQWDHDAAERFAANHDGLTTK